MKISTKLSTSIIGLGLMIIFTFSCSTQRENDFASRKYYNFPRNEGSHAGKQTGYTRSESKSSIKYQNERSVSAVHIAPNNNEKQPVRSSLLKVKNPSLTSSENPAVTTKKSYPSKGATDHVGNSKFNANVELSEDRHVPIILEQANGPDLHGAEFAVLAFLAIFIPPLAVYLKQKAITKWFWVTLILCIASTASFFISLIGGIGWLAAIAIALLIIFDMLK